MRENVKASFGATKPALGLLPPIFKLQVALAMQWGARKYGAWNFVQTDAKPIRLSTYVSAMQRHLDLLASGEDVDPETGVAHAGHIAASCAIILAAASKGLVEDDRFKSDVGGEMAKAIALMATWPEPKHEVHG